MLRFQRALLIELAFIFVLIACVVTAIVFGGFTLRFVTQGGDALGASLLGALLPKLIPVAFSYSAPFAFLAAVALVVGRWVSDHEITALKAAGVHIRALALPVLALGCALGTAGMLYNANGVATSHREVRSSLKDFLPQFLHSLQGADRSIAFETGRLSWQRFDPETSVFIGAELDKRDREGRLVQKVVVRSLRLERVTQTQNGDGLRFELQDGLVLVAQSGGDVVRRSPSERVALGSVKTIAASTGMREFLGAHRHLYRPKDMVLSELMYVIERGGVQRGSELDARIALHGRLALGSAAFFLGFFALAMSLFLPPSSRRVRDFMLSFGPAILLFFPLLLAGPTLAKNSGWPAWFAMWSPNIALFLGANILMWWGARR
ncbi:MAG: LptF/LptG family permease [Planctomycetota bacterium]|nr:LptF/LptG family permease [Planctomycetota bacterium]